MASQICYRTAALGLNGGRGGLHLEFLSGRGAALPATLTRARFSDWQALQFRCRLLHQTPATMRQAGRWNSPPSAWDRREPLVPRDVPTMCPGCRKRVPRARLPGFFTQVPRPRD